MEQRQLRGRGLSFQEGQGLVRAASLLSRSSGRREGIELLCAVGCALASCDFYAPSLWAALFQDLEAARHSAALRFGEAAAASSSFEALASLLPALRVHAERSLDSALRDSDKAEEALVSVDSAACVAFALLGASPSAILAALRDAEVLQLQEVIADLLGKCSPQQRISLSEGAATHRVPFFACCADLALLRDAAASIGSNEETATDNTAQKEKPHPEALLGFLSSILSPDCQSLLQGLVAAGSALPHSRQTLKCGVIGALMHALALRGLERK